MVYTIVDKLASYLTTLTSTNLVCSELGATFCYGTNLFTLAEPDVDATNIVTLIPYGGGPPDSQDSNKYSSNFQIRLKTRSRSRGKNVQQAFINTLHNNTQACSKCKIFSNQSAPLLIGIVEGGKSIVTVSNYSSIHVKF